MTIEQGLYTPSGFISRTEIMKKLAQEETRVTRPIIETPLTFEEHFDRVEHLQEIQKETSLWKDEMTVEVDTGKMPFFVFRPLSDMHMGAQGVDMEAIRAHLKDLKEYPVYTAMLGDIGDFFNPMKHPEGMMGDVINPDDQLGMVRSFFKEYQEKIFCTVQDPSHTDWIRQVAGIEPQRYLVEDLGITALKNGGVLNLKVNNISYKILLFHQIGRYNSSLNLTNAGKRMMDMHQDADLVVSGHLHIGAIEQLIKQNKKATILQLGTFKSDGDQYGERKGLVPRPQPFYPTLFFDGRRKNIEFIEEREAAMEWVSTLAQLQNEKL